MGSVYNSNLESLMKAMQISSRNLSEMLNVHYSLVSKWLNGRRPLNHNSSYMKQIVEIMLNLDHRNNFSIIKKILSDYYPTENFSTKESLSIYLSYYLSSNNNSNSDLSNWDAVDRSKINSRCKLDIYTNNSGRQHALVRLLDSALSLPAGQEILIYGRESVNWRSSKNSADFRLHVMNKQLAVLNKGDKITVLHSMDRDNDELIQNFLYWLPLHLTHKTQAYYLPEYMNSPIKASVTILRDKSVMFGISSPEQDSSLSTFYSTDPPVVEKSMEFFYALKPNSLSLFENTDTSETTNLSLDLSGRRGNLFLFCALPFQYFISRDEMIEILSENDIDEVSMSNCLDFFVLDKKRLLSTLDNRQTNIFIPLPQLEKALSEGIQVSYCNWLLGKPLYISPDKVRNVCYNLCDLLLDLPTLSVALINNFYILDSCSTTLLVKENYACLANDASQNVPGPLIVKEPTIVRAVYKYMEKTWRSTSKIYKEKGQVIQMISDLL